MLTANIKAPQFGLESRSRWWMKRALDGKIASHSTTIDLRLYYCFVAAFPLRKCLQWPLGKVLTCYRVKCRPAAAASCILMMRRRSASGAPMSGPCARRSGASPASFPNSVLKPAPSRVRYQTTRAGLAGLSPKNTGGGSSEPPPATFRLRDQT